MFRAIRVIKTIRSIRIKNMPDLTKLIGLNTILGQSNRLNFGEEVSFDKMSIRTFADLKSVAADQTLDLSDDPAYLMYRNVRKKGDEDKIKNRGLRFDLTVIPPAMIGKEFIKTSGHYHPKKPGTAYSYPELYFVISGQATYLLQKRSVGEAVDDVILIRASSGTPVLIPPDYGHITINELDQPLVMANWVEATFESIYSPYEDLRGAAYYIEDEFGKSKIVSNPKYMNLPPAREMKSNPILFTEAEGKPIYDYLTFENLNSLVDIETYARQLSPERVFEDVK